MPDWNDEYNEFEEDPEGPQAQDLVDDDEETPTEPCPSCGTPVPELVDRCPYCGDWIVSGSGRAGRRPTWLIVAAILALIGFILLYVI